MACEIKRPPPKTNCPSSIILSPSTASPGDVIKILLVYKGEFNKSFTAQVLFTGSSTPIKVTINNGVLISVVVPSDAVTGPITVTIPGCAPLTADFTSTIPAACELQPCTVQCPISCDRPDTTLTVGSGGDFQTIQAAIDSPEANNGAVIEVEPGNYPERITINKNNIWLNATSGVTINPPASSVSGDTIILIDGVSCAQVAGFNILIPRNLSSSYTDIAIQINGSTAEIVSNVINTETLLPLNITAIGIQALNGSHALIEENTISGLLMTGIDLTDAGTCSLTTLNTLTGNTFGGSGIQVENGATAAITSNTITNYDTDGILLLQSASGMCVISNTLTSNNVGINLTGATNTLVQQNTITGNIFGIFVSTTSCGNTFIQNNVNGNDTDIEDLTSGNQGTAGTADTYLCNSCTVDNFGGALCSSESAATPICP